MLGSRPYKKLFDIPSLPDSLLKQKFLVTPDDNYDPNTVENFMKETLRYTGTEKPLFEHEMPRTDNPHRDLYLNLHAEGTKYTHDPYHPEIYLGDHTRDPRGTENNPNVSQMADQARFRQTRYIEGKLQDDPDKRVEGVAPGKRVQRAVYDGFYNTASRLATIFTDSNDTEVRRANPHPGNTIQRAGNNIKEDQKYHESQSEKIIPRMGYNPVSLLSNQIGIQWDVQPEGKFGISSISNLYRSKGAVDASMNAVFRSGVQDEKFAESMQTFTTSTMTKTIDSIKQAKRDAASTEVTLKTDSKRNKFINRVAHPSKLQSGYAAKNTQRMQKQKFEMKHTQTRLKPFNANKPLEQIGLVEPRKHVAQHLSDHKAMPIPKKDKLKIIRSIKQDEKANRTGNEGIAQRYKKQTKKLAKRLEQYKEKNKTVILTESTVRYGTAPMHKPENRAANVQMTKDKFNQTKEQTATNIMGQKPRNVTVNVGNYEFDTDPTTDNLSLTKRHSAQKMGYIVNEHIFDNDISPLSEVVNTRRYIAKPTLKSEDEFTTAPK